MQTMQKRWLSRALRAFSALIIVTTALSQGTTQPFTFQGYLRDSSGNPIHQPGGLSMTFTLFNHPTNTGAGFQVGSPITQSVPVRNGLFTVELNFGTVWDGADRWLQIQINTTPPTVLSPRIKINPTPYAHTATLLNMFQTGTSNPDRMVITHSPPFTNWGLQYRDTDDSFHFLRAGTSVLRIGLGDGRVDILGGSWDTATTEGDLRIGNAAFRLKMGIALGGGGAGHATIAAQGGANLLSLGAGATLSTQRTLNLAGTGNVGIGTISPAHRLHVEADATARAIYSVQTAAAGVTFGGDFEVRSPSGHGLRAVNPTTARNTEARLATYYDSLLTGESNLSAGAAGFGRIGLYGRSTTGDATGVSGESENWKGVGGWTRAGYGVAGHQMGTTGTGVGVLGYAEGSTGVGVVAENAQNGPAIEIRGQIVVPNAHTSTSTPVFKHIATSANTSGHITTIDHPMCNNDPNAMLIVTHDYGPTGPYVTKPFGVWYNPGTRRWTIYIETIDPMPLGARFNVLVVKTSRGGSFLTDEEPLPSSPSAVRPEREE